MTEHDPDLRWAWAKSTYLEGGAPVSGILKTSGLPRTTFYRRARREGWLRDADCAEGRSACAPAPAPPLPDLVRRALDEAALAVLDGELQAADGWLRVVKRLREITVQDALPGAWRQAVSALKKAEPVPPDGTAVEQVRAPQTQAPQANPLPKWNSSTGFSDAELAELETAAADPQTDGERAAKAIELIARHYKREFDMLAAAGKGAESAMRATRIAGEAPARLDAP